MRLRAAVEAMPRHAREAMLRGIESNTIIVGAYADRASGGICPMLAAHRNGGRIDLASFARSWDRYTDADGPRPATRREIRTLVTLLESSLDDDDVSLAGADPPRRSLPTRVTPPERPGLAFRVRRLPRRHLSRVSARAR
ncbi:MAG: hypothetical protein BroJett022_11080 [Actinomycetes bacterium]|nr:MAG: hypothetical protein BroJett022_11080 [Actinomycetes bacterium]